MKRGRSWISGGTSRFFCSQSDERIPILHSLPFKHKGIMTAPLLGPIEIEKYLAMGQIEQVICGGENYDGARPCDYDWVRSLHRQCANQNVTFCFIETGTNFIKDGRRYFLPNKRVQSEMAYKSGISYQGKPMKFKLEDDYGLFDAGRKYEKYFGPQCEKCGSRMICNGCARCGKCTVLEGK